jgi:hypothetical protein
MKQIILLILIFFININCNAADIPTIAEVETSEGVSLLTETIRRLNKSTQQNSLTLGTASSALAMTGFCVVLSGDAEVLTNVIPSRLYMPFGGTITKIIAYANTAPTGANLIIDFNKNGSTILDASKITIAASGNTVTVVNFASSEFNINDYFTVDVDQIGSSVAGADITLSVYITKAI